MLIYVSLLTKIFEPARYVLTEPRSYIRKGIVLLSAMNLRTERETLILVYLLHGFWFISCLFVKLLKRKDGFIIMKTNRDQADRVLYD
jgi:hypothetical protein